MNPNHASPLNTETLDIPASFFQAREQAGPLTPMEHCYRAVCTKGFAALIECDAVMGLAQLTPAGERWLAPIIRNVLELDGPWPLAALDWIALYHRSRDLALRHFSEWNERTQRPAHTPTRVAYRLRAGRFGKGREAANSLAMTPTH